MNRHKLALVIFAIIFAPAFGSVAQIGSNEGPRSRLTTREELVRSFQIESRKGINLFYTQTYKVHGHRVEFHGSIFGVIEQVEADGCELKIRSELVDLYSGSIGEHIPRRTQTKYVSTIRFELTARIADDLKVAVARPVRQLSIGSNAICSDSPQCNLTWIKLKAPTRVIHLTEITNDVADYDGEVQDFDGAVDQFFLPVSSAEAGNDLIGKMRAFAHSCSS